MDPKQACVMEIHRKYKIHFGIKDDENEVAVRRQAKEEALKLACRNAMKGGILLKSLFKGFEIPSSPGKCGRGEFMNILENKLGLAKETNP